MALDSTGSENKCQNVMSSQGLELSSLCQLSLGLSFLKSCLFDRTLALAPQICHFSLQTRLEKKLCFQYYFFFFVERFSSFYLGSKGQGTSMTWINRLEAGDHKVAAPPEACLAGAGQVCCIAGQCKAGTDCCSHILGVIYVHLISCVAIVGLD